MRLRRLALLLVLPLYGACSVAYLRTSDTASQVADVARLAPDPVIVREAVVQIYGARVAQWHGYFGIHTWIAVKRSDAQAFVVYEVTRDHLEQTGSAVLEHTRQADELWYGNAPALLKDKRGAGVDALIDRIELAVESYPFADRYRIWPGPNSNTFVAYVSREVPELRVDLPSTAVGKDYLGNNPLARLPSGTGGQLSLFGLLGVAAGWEEGVEVNVLGLTIGVDPNSIALDLPMVGRVGPDR
jgi:Protein of unknown function (DUF3750)